MTLEQRILKVKDSQVGWFDGHELRVIAEDVCKMENRIKRLEEALEATAKVIGPPGKSTWVSDDELNHAWELYIKAKEAKP